MPIHDWSRVFDGVFHDFHTSWNIEIRNALNGGILPAGYYAMAEQVARRAVADVLTLRTKTSRPDNDPGEPIGGATAVTIAPPRVQHSDRIEAEPFTRRQKSVVIRHASDDRVIALIEILSAGNKSSNQEFRAFVNKATSFLDRGYHLVLIDLHARTKRDPGGIHLVIWEKLGGRPKPIPAEKPLMLAAYDAGPPPTAYIEPLGVGDTLSDMPLFLAPEWYVPVPLEATYQAAYRGTPRRFREVLESAAGDG
jgi:hypothetical protein